MSETVQASSTVRDFDFWLGRWSVRNRWLRERLAGSTEWEEFGASVVARPTLDGIGNEDLFRTEHADYLRHRSEWFERLAEAPTALWWIAKGGIPAIDEAKRRLELLRANGPTPEAFTLRATFPPPEERAHEASSSVEA